jgi:RimJ/RimL family protein N-acetyltransferase
MYLEQENLIIRSANLDDSQILTHWWNDGKVMAHAGFPKGLGTTIEKTNELIKQNEHNLSQRCIIESYNQRIGECSFRIFDNLAEIGIKICDPSFQNQGLGYKLLQMLIHFLFTDNDINNAMKIKKIILDTNAKNQRAQHVYENLGFRKIKTNPDAWQDQLGEWQTSIDYEMTSDEFKLIYNKET